MCSVGILLVNIWPNTKDKQRNLHVSLGWLIVFPFFFLLLQFIDNNSYFDQQQLLFWIKEKMNSYLFLKIEEKVILRNFLRFLVYSSSFFYFHKQLYNFL